MLFATELIKTSLFISIISICNPDLILAVNGGNKRRAETLIWLNTVRIKRREPRCVKYVRKLGQENYRLLPNVEHFNEPRTERRVWLGIPSIWRLEGVAPRSPDADVPWSPRPSGCQFLHVCHYKDSRPARPSSTHVNTRSCQKNTSSEKLQTVSLTFDLQ